MQKRLTRDQVLAELSLLKPLLVERYSVKSLALFGSYAKDTARESSDIDLVIELDEPDLFFLGHIKDEIERDLQHHVDLIPYTQYMSPFLKERVLKEAVYV